MRTRGLSNGGRTRSCGSLARRCGGVPPRRHDHDSGSIAALLGASPGASTAAPIMLTVLAFNLLGDGLRDALDPRLRSR